MQRIVFIIRRYSPGQAWTNRLLAYAKGFAEQKARVVICFLITDNQRTPYEINIKGVEVVNLWESDNFIFRQHRALSYIRNKRRIKDVLQDGDVCFMSDGSGSYIKDVLSSGKNVKIAFEATEHPQVLMSDNSKVEHYLRSLAKVDILYVISHSLKNYFINKGVCNNKIHIINMFVDTDRFKSVKKTSEEKNIAYCGAISYDKDGVDVLIKAFEIFHSKHMEYKLYIYGSFINKETESKLLELRQKCNLDNSVIFTGPIPFSEMPQRLVNASVLALARPNNLQSANGFPTKLGEYLTTGNPVVVTNVGEIPLFIHDGVNGYLSEPDSPECFAKKLEEAVLPSHDTLRVGSMGKQLSDKEFNYRIQTEIAYNIIMNHNCRL